MLPFVGVSYTLPDRQAAAQRTVNMYLQAMETVSKAGHILTAMPGLGPGTGGSGGVLGVGPVPPFGGLAPAATISGRVWLDADADGVQDGGELGIAGVAVTLLAPGGGTVATTTTDAGGAYSFSVEAGSYRISVDVAGYEVSPQDVGGNDAADSDTDAAGLSDLITVAEGGAASVDCGLYETASISGTVWYDADGDGQLDEVGAGVFEAAVTLKTAAGATVASTATAYAGTYSFSGVVPGTYKIAVAIPDGYLATLQDTGAEATDSDIDGTGETATFTLVSGQALTGVNAGFVVDIPEIEAEAVIDWETSFASLPPEYGITAVYSGGGFHGLVNNLQLPDPDAFPHITPTFTDTPANSLRIFPSRILTITVTDPSITPYNTISLIHHGPCRIVVESENPFETAVDLRFFSAADQGWRRFAATKVGEGLLTGAETWAVLRIKRIYLLVDNLSLEASFGCFFDDFRLSIT
jgi:hypothetical protein